MALLGQQHASGVGGKHGEYSEPLLLLAEGQVQTWRARQGICSETSLLRMICDPLRDAEVCRTKRLIERRIRGIAQLFISLWKKNHRPTLKHLGDVADRDACHARNSA